MLEGARIVVVVPAFEEAPRLGGVLSTLPAFVDQAIVVDDASRDETSAVARRFAPRAELLRHERNLGVGAAIATGYRRALDLTSSPGDVIAVMAGDAQMHPGDLAALIVPVARGACDYAKGNRFAWPSSVGSIPLGRRTGIRVLSVLTSVAIGRRIYDAQSGYTAIARRTLVGIDLGSLYPGFGYPNDLLGRLAHARILEVPVRPVYGSEKSKLRPWHVPRILRLIGRAAVRARLGR